MVALKSVSNVMVVSDVIRSAVVDLDFYRRSRFRDPVEGSAGMGDWILARNVMAGWVALIVDVCRVSLRRSQSQPAAHQFPVRFPY
jgi:hypothetical protein